MEITGARSLSSVKELIAWCGLPKCLGACLPGVVGAGSALRVIGRMSTKPLLRVAPSRAAPGLAMPGAVEPLLLLSACAFAARTPCSLPAFITTLDLHVVGTRSGTGAQTPSLRGHSCWLQRSLTAPIDGSR